MVGSDRSILKAGSPISKRMNEWREGGARNTSRSVVASALSLQKFRFVLPIYGLHFSRLAVLCVWSAKRERGREGEGESNVKREPQTGNIFVQPVPRAGGSGNVLDCAFHSTA